MALPPKQHQEFVGVDMKNGWEVPPGYPPGFTQKVLGTDLDVAGQGDALPIGLPVIRQHSPADLVQIGLKAVSRVHQPPARS